MNFECRSVFFLAIQHLDIMKGQMRHPWLSTLCFTDTERICASKQGNQFTVSFRRKRESLVHAFMRDFPTYILHTAVPVVNNYTPNSCPRISESLGLSKLLKILEANERSLR